MAKVRERPGILGKVFQLLCECKFNCDRASRVRRPAECRLQLRYMITVRGLSAEFRAGAVSLRVIRPNLNDGIEVRLRCLKVPDHALSHGEIKAIVNALRDSLHGVLEMLERSGWVLEERQQSTQCIVKRRGQEVVLSFSRDGEGIGASTKTQ